MSINSRLATLLTTIRLHAEVDALVALQVVVAVERLHTLVALEGTIHEGQAVGKRVAKVGSGGNVYRVGGTVASKWRKTLSWVADQSRSRDRGEVARVRRTVRVRVGERAGHVDGRRAAVRRSGVVALLRVDGGATRRVLRRGISSACARGVVWAGCGRGRLGADTANSSLVHDGEGGVARERSRRGRAVGFASGD